MRAVESFSLRTLYLKSMQWLDNIGNFSTACVVHLDSLSTGSGTAGIRGRLAALQPWETPSRPMTLLRWRVCRFSAEFASFSRGSETSSEELYNMFVCDTTVHSPNKS